MESRPQKDDLKSQCAEISFRCISGKEAFSKTQVCEAEEDAIMSYENIPREIRKYWQRRYNLFSRFDEGIMLDYESWFSVTPEEISKYIADILACEVIIDGFCGAGGNTVQFAKRCKEVIAMDISLKKIFYCIHNTSLYGVDSNIKFIHGDFTTVKREHFKADIVFCSPPWGGVSYILNEEFIPQTMLGIDFKHLIENSLSLAKSLCIFLPKNTKIETLSEVSKGNYYCVESVYLDGNLNGLLVYYGEIANKIVSEAKETSRIINL